MDNSFKHIQSAHCENGVITSFLRNSGQDFMTEPLAFGMGSGLFYVHLPFIKLNGGPAISFRTMPGQIFKRTAKSLNIEFESKRFRKELDAQLFLDKRINEGLLVGCQVGVFNLSYFPKEYRFHFNAHNLIVYGKEGDDYLVSDPIMDKVTTLPVETMNRVRFAQGIYAPKGHVYYLKEKVAPISEEVIRKGIIKGVKRNVRDMLSIPGNIAGVKGIVHTSNQIRKWRDKYGVRKTGLYLGQIIRMQEEIGTGGGGFRFIYAAFLEEAAKYFQDGSFLKISDDFTKSGDLWRNSAMKMAGVLRGRNTEQKDLDEIADMMVEIHHVEKKAFLDLKQKIKTY